MFVFARTMFKPTDLCTGVVDRDLKTHPLYAKYKPDVYLTKHLTVADTLRLGRRVLGEELWQKLLLQGGRETLGVSAEVLHDHLYNHDPYGTKDLQVNLVSNVIKELATQDTVHRAQYCARANEILLNLAMTRDFRATVEDSLYLNGAIYQPWLIIHRRDV